MLALSPWGMAWSQSVPQPWQYCEPDELASAVTPYTGAPKEGDPIRFTADTAESSESEAILEGDVLVEQGDQRLEASEVTMDRLTNHIEADGDIIYGSPDLALRSRHAEVLLDDKTGEFKDAEYFLPGRNAQGRAEQVAVDRRSRESTLKNVTYSTCTRNHEFWQMRTDRMEIDEDKGRGEAWDITLAIKDIPVFYFPYLSFPINDDRQSGFLFPSIGYDSDSGADIRIPYYLNIAPDRDATFASRILMKRGLMLGAEYRFLNPKDRGLFALEYLPSDQEFGDDRSSVYLEYQANPASNLYTDLLLQNVSDDDYLDDLDNNLGLLSPTVLERRWNTAFYGGEWSAQLRFQDYQTIDDEIFTDDNEPYERLPQLLFDGVWPHRVFGLNYELRSELVYFDHNSKETGTRVDVQPGISLPLEWPAGFINPRLSYRYTAYHLNDTEPGAEDSLDRGAPVVSLDGGLFFERPISWTWWDKEGIQTLEPRLFYLYTPFRDQSDIPVFDSTEVDRSYAWLFLDNRFTGADRLGDANQLTTAVTTRLLGAEDGREWLRLSAGQIHYFEDRRVTLENTETKEDSRSEVITEGMLSVTPELFVRGTLQWDTDVDRTLRSALDLRYHGDNGKLVNLAHRLSKDELEQIDISLLWPINPRWRTMARWNYSLSDKRNLNAFVGFEYGECCWALRMLARQHRDSPDDEKAKNSVLFELELKGLAGIGSRIDKFLENNILGFQRTRYY